VDAKTWRPQLNGMSMVESLEYAQKLIRFMPAGWSGLKYLDTRPPSPTARSPAYSAHAPSAEKYAPEGAAAESQHFIRTPPARPVGPRPPLTARTAVFTQSKCRRGPSSAPLLPKDNYLAYTTPCPSPDADLQVDAQRSRLPANRHQEMAAVAA
jgi:hypothetical protein